MGHRSARPWLLGVLVSTFCGAGCNRDRMIGTIDGMEWPLSDSFLVRSEEAYGDDDLLVITLSSLPDACRTWQLWDASVTEDATPEELAEAWQQVFPNVFWEVHIGARMLSGSWPVSRTGWAGASWDNEPHGPEVVYARFVEHRDARPPGWFEPEGLPPDDALEIEEIYRSHAGAIKWSTNSPSRVAAGRFNTDVADAEGNRIGRVELRFHATPCQTLPQLEPAQDPPAEE